MEKTAQITEKHRSDTLEWKDMKAYFTSGKVGFWKMEVEPGKQSRMYVDEYMHSLVGLPEEALSPEEKYSFFKAHIHPEDTHLLERFKTDMVMGETVVEFRYCHPQEGEKYLRCSGRIVAVEADCTIVMGFDQELSNVLHIGQSPQWTNQILHQKQNLEIEQSRADDYYKNLLDIVKCGVVSYTVEEHRLLHMNEEALRIFGAKDLIHVQNNMYEIWCNVFYADPSVPARLKQISVGSDSFEYECTIRNLKGHNTNVLARSEAFLSPQGERCVITTILDISESLVLKNEKKELEETAREARRANEAKTNFLRRMSHDIRTPLNGIIGLLKIDEQHFDNRELVKENHKKMEVSANHLLSLINDILQTSKLEDGNAQLTHEVIKLTELTQDIVNIIIGRAVEAGLTWDYEKGKVHIPYPYIYGSPVHLRQIFLNIYGNCIKYNRPGGKITTVVDTLPEHDGICMYRWIISDTGIGMSQEFLKHIFDPFAQASTDARSTYQGIGLGMFIVKGLIDQMGGTIKVTSQEGVGSTFEIVLPFEIAPAPEEQVVDEKLSESSIEGLHLLLAEDNALNAEIAETLLRDEGAVITVVSDGKQAVDLYASSRPGTFDAILMDIMMPVMDGLTAAKAIRTMEREDAKRIPIIAMTANAFKEDVKQCLEAGMNAHLAKPLNMDEVVPVIARFCTK